MVTGSKVKLLWGHEETRRNRAGGAPLRRTTHSHGPGALERGVRLWRILDGRAGRCVPAPAVRSLPLSLARTRGIRCEGRLFPFTRVGPGARHRLMTRRRITTHHHRPHASACGPVVGARAEHRAKGAAHAIALGHPPRSEDSPSRLDSFIGSARGQLADRRRPRSYRRLRRMIKTRPASTGEVPRGTVSRSLAI